MTIADADVPWREAYQTVWKDHQRTLAQLTALKDCLEGLRYQVLSRIHDEGLDTLACQNLVVWINKTLADPDVAPCRPQEPPRP